MASAPLRFAATAAAALLAGLSAARAMAEPPRTVPLFFEVSAAGTGADPGCMGATLLTEPPGWSLGDAVAVVVADHERRDAGRDRLAGAMLAESAAVLELGPGGPCGGAAALFGALRALRRDVGAGLVVAIGCGAGGEAALAAVSEAEAASHLGPSSRDRDAAVASFGTGRAAFAPGPAPAAGRAWPMRAGLLCEALARASAAEGAGGEGARRAAAHDCLKEVVPPGGMDGRGRAAMAATAPRR